MKKILLTATVLAVIGAFAACSLIDSLKRDDSSPTSLTGVLKEQSGDDVRSGSHLLVSENGDETPIRSLSINLSSDKYLGNKVQILGKESPDDKIFEVTGISVLEKLTETSFERDFKEYKNTDLGFRVKYYSDWTVDENGNIITFIAPKSADSIVADKVVITQSPFDFVKDTTVQDEPLAEKISPVEEVKDAELTLDNNDIKLALTAYFNENFPDKKSLDFRNIGLDKMNAVKVDISNDTEYYFYRSGFVYKIAFTASKTNFVAENKVVFNKMLAEFQFLGFTVEDSSGNSSENTADESVAPEVVTPEVADETSDETVSTDMAVFESLIYHFSAQYPENWYYAGVRGSSTGVLHHYGFSDGPLDTKTELISMDIMASAKPNGSEIPGLDAVSTDNGQTYTAYITVEGQNYKISGANEYKDVILAMARSIKPIVVDAPVQ